MTNMKETSTNTVDNQELKRDYVAIALLREIQKQNLARDPMVKKLKKIVRKAYPIRSRLVSLLLRDDDMVLIFMKKLLKNQEGEQNA